LPSWKEIIDLMDEHHVPDSMMISHAVYGMSFTGDTTSMSGATGQNLRESLDRSTGQIGVPSAACPIHPLIARLYMARPDLRVVLEDRFDLSQLQGSGAGDGEFTTSVMGCSDPECPILIHGYVWKKTQDWIGTYGDVDTLLAWKFLEADLTAGHEFTHQLVPSLADDVFLHCKVRGKTRISTGYQTFWNGLDCLYIIDYGSWTWTGPGGEELLCCRTIDYGRVIYVPEVGPVHSYERILVGLGEYVGPGFGERILSLTDTGLPLE
jgi:hypothetical protein